MMNKYNPYTVPENYFEDIKKQAVARYRYRMHVMKYGIAAVAVAFFIVAIPFFFNHSITEPQQEQEVVANNLADMYDYDIFLQVNFSN